MLRKDLRPYLLNLGHSRLALAVVVVLCATLMLRLRRCRTSVSEIPLMWGRYTHRCSLSWLVLWSSHDASRVEFSLCPQSLLYTILSHYNIFHYCRVYEEKGRFNIGASHPRNGRQDERKGTLFYQLHSIFII